MSYFDNNSDDYTILIMASAALERSIMASASLQKYLFTSSS